MLQSDEAIRKIRTLTPCAFNAPTVLLVCYDADETWHSRFDEGVESGPQDASIVAVHMMLMAWTLGIGSCWVNYFSREKVRTAFGIPEHEVPLLLMPVGYPAENAGPLDLHGQYRPMEETVRYK